MFPSSFSPNPPVPCNTLSVWIDSQKCSADDSAYLPGLQCMLWSGLRLVPFSDYNRNRLGSQFRLSLEESVELEHLLLIDLIAVVHGSHEAQMVPHEGSKKASKSRCRPQCFESSPKIGFEERSHNWRGRPLVIFSFQLCHRVFR